MELHEHRARPAAWSETKRNIKRRWAVPFAAVEWFWEWSAYRLSNWKFLHVVNYLRSSGMVLGVVRLSIEQLEIFACGELPAQLWNNRCGDFLFFRIGRPAEAETLSSLAG